MTETMSWKSIFLLAICVSMAMSAKDHQKFHTTIPAKKPHIIFLLVDDWGWANVGYHRIHHTQEVATINFDNLVKEGLELDQYYTFNQCGPSRCSFLTGRLPIHVNDKNMEPQYYNPDDPVSGFTGIPRNMTGIGEKMKQAGYATHQVGKWDAGMATPDHIPTGRGFDSSLGYFHHANDYYTELENNCNGTPIVDLWKTDKPALSLNGTGPGNYEEGLFKTTVMNIINEHDPSTPLFLYYAPHIVHTPLQVPNSYLTKFSFIDNSDRKYYHAMVNYLNDVVGELVDTLKKKGMWEDTLFVVSSDNGGPEYYGGGANNYPLRGGKLTDWQGGIRVNAFVSGGFLPEKMRGQKTEEYIHVADWFSTFCALAGVDPTDEAAAQVDLPPIDSINMWPLLSGQNATATRVEIPISYRTLISGEFKILTGMQLQASWTGPEYPNNTNPHGGIAAVQDCGGSGCLYNIRKDPEERENLATRMPDVLKSMQQKLAKHQATYFNPNRGNIWPGACDAALTKYNGFWGPFLP